jgi:hypothetical protein
MVAPEVGIAGHDCRAAEGERVLPAFRKEGERTVRALEAYAAGLP